MARTRVLLCLCLALAASIGASQEDAQLGGSLRSFTPSRRDGQVQLEEALLELPSAASLRAAHELVSSRPHVASSEGDLAVVDALEAAYERLGLQVERQEIWTYLPLPVSASVEILGVETVSLDLREESVEGDPWVDDDETDFGWNAYSGSGDATGEVVYANYGTREDFERLSALGVEVEGKVVIARYGANFRGHKVRFAEQAGAAALLIYSDPIDAGYVKGLMYPEGGWANGSYIQRGSVMVLPYSGDPLTPFEPATEHATRLDPDEVPLPRIPVQPLGWKAAEQIMSLMRGAPVPESWQGGLPFNYRLTGGADLTVRVQVEQERKLRRTFNLVGRLIGSVYPDELVIVGSHHDAWSFGAGDPNAGTIVVYETARSFAELARRGVRPARTLVFANWGAEEFGIIGSVEWVEAHRGELAANAIAYINLDGAAMGPVFAASAAPLLKELVLDAAGQVPSSSGAGTVLDDWRERTAKDGGEPRIGNLGGGSDHVGFYCHLGIPSAGVSGGGSSGTSYHSNYENLTWYRKVVGEDYGSALMLSRVVNIMLARLANADLLPLSFERYGLDLASHAEALLERSEDSPALTALAQRGRSWSHRAHDVRERLLADIEAESLAPEQLARANFELLRLERAWLAADGLPGRPWFRNLFAATDEDSGYAAWMLPAVRWAIERGEDIDEQSRQYALVLDALERKLTILENASNPTDQGAQ